MTTIGCKKGTTYFKGRYNVVVTVERLCPLTTTNYNTHHIIGDKFSHFLSLFKWRDTLQDTTQSTSNYPNIDKQRNLFWNLRCYSHFSSKTISSNCIGSKDVPTNLATKLVNASNKCWWNNFDFHSLTCQTGPRWIDRHHWLHSLT